MTDWGAQCLLSIKSSLDTDLGDCVKDKVQGGEEQLIVAEYQVKHLLRNPDPYKAVGTDRMHLLVQRDLDDKVQPCCDISDTGIYYICLQKKLKRMIRQSAGWSASASFWGLENQCKYYWKWFLGTKKRRWLKTHLPKLNHAWPTWLPSVLKHLWIKGELCPVLDPSVQERS